MAVDPRVEARERTSGRFDVRVLDPSPAGFEEPPWFADDPVNAPVSGDRPVVSPVPNGDRTWDAVAADEPDLADWCADHWLGAWRHPRPIDDVATFVATRDALHAVGEHVLAAARHAANGKIGLRVTHRGFGTPFFEHDGQPAQLRVDGTDLVVVHGDDVTRTPLTVLSSPTRGSHAFPTTKPEGDLDLGYPTATVWSADLVRQIDTRAAAQLADVFGFACSVLEEFRCGQLDGDTTRVQLWPEHFDLSIDLGDDAAGDPGHLRVVARRRRPPRALPVRDALGATWQPDPFWNDAAFNGASLTYRELLADADDQRAAALDFFRTGWSILHPRRRGRHDEHRAPYHRADRRAASLAPVASRVLAVPQVILFGGMASCSCCTRTR